MSRLILTPLPSLLQANPVQFQRRRLIVKFFKLLHIRDRFILLLKRIAIAPNHTKSQSDDGGAVLRSGIATRRYCGRECGVLAWRRVKQQIRVAAFLTPLDKCSLCSVC